MTLYQIIYNWFLDLLNGSNLNSFTTSVGNNAITYDVWLAHTGTIIVLIACCLFLFGCVKYLFKAGAGLFKW